MTPEQKEFLKRIEELPEDENCRVVYADYLDELGFPHEAAWHRAGGRMTGDEFWSSIVGQDDDNDYQESGYVACVVERAGLRIGLLGNYGHCSCYGTWECLAGGGISDSFSGSEEKHPVWNWIGSVGELIAMAGRNADPIIPTREISKDDCDGDHLLAVYRQVLEWAKNGRVV